MLKKINFKFLFSQIVICLICAELVLQLFHGAYQVTPYSISSKPQLCLNCHQTRGFGLSPGKFQVSINQKVNFTCTIGKDSSRITKPASDTLAGKPEIHIHGCSFAFGMGVDDTLTYPYLLQSKHNNLNIKNLAVPGNGTLQTLLGLKEQLKNKELPDAIILNYASFHDERNVLNLNYREALFYGFKHANQQIEPLFKECKFPYAFLDKNPKKLKFNYIDWNNLYSHWKYRDVLASVNFIQTTRENFQILQENDHKITRLLLRQIHLLCQENDIDLVVALMTSDMPSSIIKTYCKTLNIKTIDLNLDLASPRYTNLPYDSHPNALAHKEYAERISSAIFF